MKRCIPLSLMAVIAVSPLCAEQIQLNGNTHELEELISRQVGPGITYKRLRSSTYPLNVNMIMVDVTNPYVSVATTTANESAAGTESLVKQAARTSGPEHRAVAGANGNFWCVASQEPNYPLLSGSCYGGHAKNGQMITETNTASNQWNHGWTHTGIVGISPDRSLHVGHHYYSGCISHPSLGSGNPAIQQINKLVGPDEIGLYNSFYGRSKEFRPVVLATNSSSGKTEWTVTRDNDCTEVLLDFAEGENWRIGQPMRMTVRDVRTNSGNGTLGDYAAALVGKGSGATSLASLQAGDEITLETNYYDSANNLITLDNFIAGNATVMIGGELTSFNTSEGYNSQVYSRTGYGASADGKTLYIIVIDKSTDPVYGNSAGCPTRVMCEIASHYGCTDMVNFDAGGSAMMYLDGAIINRTTEGTPRAVSNGMLCYSTAPADSEVASLAFDDISLTAPPFSSFTPKIIAYNRYGDVIDYDFKGFTLSCDPSLGTCEGAIFVAGAEAVTAPLTASYGDVSVSKDLTIVSAVPQLRIPNLLTDISREYPIEVTAAIGSNIYIYDPARIDWTVDDPSVATVTNGVLKGLREGICTVTGHIAEDVDVTMNVTVQAASTTLMDLTDWADWKLTNVGITASSLDAEGTVSYTYGINARTGSSLQLGKVVPFYSLPDHIWVSFNSSVPVERVTADIRRPEDTRIHLAEIAPAEAYAVNTPHTVELPMEDICDPDDLASFPLTLNTLKFVFTKDDALKGTAQTIKINSIQGEYANTTGVEKISVANNPAITIYPNPVADGVLHISGAGALGDILVYSVAGVKVASHHTAEASAHINIEHLLPGIYIVRAAGATRRVIVR